MGNSTHGRKLLPVPISLEDGLRSRGFRPLVPVLENTHRWVHPKYRTTTVTFVPSTIPGDTAVTATFEQLGGGPRRLDTDALLALMDTLMGVRR